VATSTSRRPSFDRFVARLAQRVDAFVVGDPFEAATDIGPIAFAAQRERVAGYLALAVRERATVITGGTMPALEGCYVAPTVLTRVSAESRLMREEIESLRSRPPQPPRLSGDGGARTSVFPVIVVGVVSCADPPVAAGDQRRR
jgi:hypothetical protein